MFNRNRFHNANSTYLYSFHVYISNMFERKGLIKCSCAFFSVISTNVYGMLTNCAEYF